MPRRAAAKLEALKINSQSLDDNALFIRSDVDFHRVLAEIPGTLSSWRSTLRCWTG
jgi:DNA-binding FadR family transcriptional regulator